MIETFTNKYNSPLPAVLLAILLFLGHGGFGQNCYTGTGPQLDAGNAVTQICPGQKAVLALQPFSSAETAIWYGSANRTLVLAVLSDTDQAFSANPGVSRSYWVALRQNDGCESDLLEVRITRLDHGTCPVRNENKGCSYKNLPDAVDDATPGDKLLLPPGQYQATSVNKRLKLSGETPSGQTQKAEVFLQGLEMNGDIDLELNEGIFLINGTLNLKKGNLKMGSGSAMVIKGKIENGDSGSAIELPVVGQGIAADFLAEGKPISPGAIRLESINTIGKHFLPLYARNGSGSETYFPILLEAKDDNLAEVFDIAIAGPASLAETQTYPGLPAEEAAGIQELAKAVNQRPSKVDQIFLLSPADGNNGSLSLAISAEATLGGPNHPILWNWEPLGIDPTIMTIDNDVALFRGVKMILSGFNTYSTLEPVTSFSPFAIVAGPLLEGPPATDMANVERETQTLRGKLSEGNAITTPGSPCFDPALQKAGNHFYEIIPFTTTQKDVYTFELDFTGFNGPAFGAIYKHGIDMDNPCQSLLLIGTENELPDGSYYREGKPLFRVLLENDTQYYLLTFSKEPIQTGDYTWRIWSDHGGSINADGIAQGRQFFSGPLSSLDLDLVYQPAGGAYTVDENGRLVSASSPELELTLRATGYAMVAGCTGAIIQVSDVLHSKSCGEDTIERTFSVVSPADCASPTPENYMQVLTLRKPTVAANDFIAPPHYTFVDLDLDIPLDGEGKPSPAITGLPMIASPFAFYNLDSLQTPLEQRYANAPTSPVAGVAAQFKRDWQQSNSCVPNDIFSFSQDIRHWGQPVYNATTRQYSSTLQMAVQTALQLDSLILLPGKSYGNVVIDKDLTFVTRGTDTAQLGSITIDRGALLRTRGVFGLDSLISKHPNADQGGGLEIFEGEIDIAGGIEGFGSQAPLRLGSDRSELRIRLNQDQIFLPVAYRSADHDSYVPLSIRVPAPPPQPMRAKIRISGPGHISDHFPASVMGAFPNFVDQIWDISLIDQQGRMTNHTYDLSLYFPDELITGDISLPTVLNNHEGELRSYRGIMVHGVSLDGNVEVESESHLKVSIAGVQEGSPFAIFGCPEPATVTASCNDLINVALLDDCTAVVTPDMVLEGSLGCGYQTADYEVVVYYLDGSRTAGYVDRPGRFIYEVSGPLGFNCRGEILAEDKSAPRFVCAPTVIDHVYRTYQTQTASGSLRQHPRGQINFSAYSCFQDEYGAPADCPEPYDLVEFYVSQTDIYTFEAWDPKRIPVEAENDNELHIALFQGDFDAGKPCANILARSNVVSEYGIVENEQDPDGRFRLALPLVPGQKYTLLIARNGCSLDRGDQWTLYAFSDGKGEILDSSNGLADRFNDPAPLQAKKRLYCSDAGYILNNVDYIPPPQLTDNCDANPTAWFEDVLTRNGDCGAIYITRTWHARDNAGNTGESCIQIIEFKRPGLRDVQKPPTTVTIECDEIDGNGLDQSGRPKPEIAGYPFIITAFGIADLHESLCNVGADYTDISDIKICAGAHQIVRQWTILDWCQVSGQWLLNNGNEVNWRQTIKVGDFSAPKVSTGNDLTINTGPFSCQSVLIIPNIEVTDNCSEYTIKATVYKVVIENEVDRYGRPTGTIITREEKIATGTVGSAVPNIEIGADYRLYYQVEDACGNVTAPAPVTVRAEDHTEPIAICADDLTVSLGGEGIARITAGDLNKGSWDNCSLADILISRQLAGDNLRDAWLTQVESLAFSDLIPAGHDDPSGDGAEQWIEKNAEKVILRRKNGVWFTAWHAEQYFLCHDTDNSVIMELAVFDAAGNVNACWLNIHVEDKVSPTCIAPPTVTWECTKLPDGFDPYDDAQLDLLFGRAAATDNCPGDTAYQVRKQIAWECNSGMIERWFEAKDKHDLQSRNNCQQRIAILPVHHYEIRFPADAAAECGRPNPDTALVTEIACDLLSVAFTDERFAASEGDACYKIKRTYQVINWCEYNGEDDPVVIGRNEDCDNASGEEAVYILRRPDATYLDRDNNEKVNPTVSPCGNNTQGHLSNSNLESRLISTGYWQYTQYIKVYDRTGPVITVDAPTPFCADNAFVRCSGDVRIPFSVSEECDDAGLAVQVWLDVNNDGAVDFEVTTAVLSGAHPNYKISGNYPIGTYTFEIRVADGCSNGAARRIPFEIVDCKAPTPICINGLAVELMPQEAGADVDGDGDEDAGAISIWATDFKVSFTQDCTPDYTYSINRVGETPDIGRQNLILTCDDPDTVKVEIYLWDGAFNPYAVQPDGTIGGPNYDHCVTYVVVQDNRFDLCHDPSLVVAGLIATEADKAVEDVEVRLSGPATQTHMTDLDGRYAFNQLAGGADYTIRPWKDNGHLNGVSTFDLVLLTKHLLGIRKLNSPYLMIAADVNRSQTLSTLDLIQLRKMVLSIDTRFRDNPSWRFIPRDYVFPEPDNPWSTPFPEVLSFNDLNSTETNADFVAIKIGDLNGNARPNSLVTHERNMVGTFSIEVEDLRLQPGREYEVSFTTAQLERIQGYQFTLEFDRQALDLVDMEYGIGGASDFGMVYVEEGAITTSWNKLEMSEFNKNTAAKFSGEKGKAELFKLIFRASKNAKLSDLIDINSRYTEAEAYDWSDELLAVDLNFSYAAVREPKLYQNEPNPFTGETVISFDLPSEQSATITIRDLNGRTLRVVRGEYTKGLNRVTVKSNDLPKTGVLYYSLETVDFTMTRKMIAMDE